MKVSKQINNFQVYGFEGLDHKEAMNIQRNMNITKKDAQKLEAELYLFRVIERESWDLRCINAPTGGDDYDIVWHVIEHYMAEPQERIIGQGNNPLEAIEQALKGDKNESTS